MLAIYLSMLETEEQRNKLEDIYCKYYGLLYHEAYTVLQNHELAEDCVHETFLYLIRIINTIRVENNRETIAFLKLISRHKALDQIKKQKHTSLMEDAFWDTQEESESNNPETVAVNAVLLERVIETISTMNEVYSVPLSLQVKGYKIQEIADILEISPQAVRVRIHRARKQLAATLEEN